MIVLLVNTAAVLFMTGFIWTMQLVHYPLFDRVGEAAFPTYEAAHNRLFALVAVPGAAITVVSAVVLLVDRPARLPLTAPIAGVALFVIIMVSTARLQAPAHAKLTRSFDRDVYTSLLRTNWIRTAAWSAYSFLALWMIWRIS